MARKLPECWGHRGASAAFPENTLASFEGAARDGAEGIESDVHVSLDGVIMMFHDPALGRTTDGHGLIREQNYHGEQGMEHVRTKKEPKQPIPTFNQTVGLLMKPDNKHLKFNLDVKVYNDPVRLFTIMHEVIASQPNWETDLAPRILLGLWHPKFLNPAKDLLPYCRRAHIGMSPDIARKYFWDQCDGFSMNFGALVTVEGKQFIKDCKAGNKEVMVWTVNKKEEMMECVRWEVNAILTDVTKTWLDLRKELAADYDGTLQKESGWLYAWLSPRYYSPFQWYLWRLEQQMLERHGGPFDKPEVTTETTPAVAEA
ncbi:PLC-like phosphodiesterase [Dacryopinax primogenitus]|uniref:PLC-like phosphodiesterase n=1 Tax=Dacryopinax primogenitus (strain DJM 731) TaxID=1858805 RepID=M5GFR6_DACPD|nr:PLC-like phosphodiesterase [Dacryopinax primogenitus]EJU06532.1 PLC-like phosphodiesterase [Dacryopinax primogenitus]